MAVLVFVCPADWSATKKELTASSEQVTGSERLLRSARRYLLTENRERRTIQDILGNRESGAGRGHLQEPRCAARQIAPWPLQRRRDLFSDSGKRTRRGRFRGAALLVSGGQPSTGTLADDRRVQARFRLADNRRVAVLLLCAARPQR